MCKVDELIQILNGTCNTIDYGVVEVYGSGKNMFSLTEDELTKIDETIFRCECCGWWMDVEKNVGDDETVCCSCIDEYNS